MVAASRCFNILFRCKGSFNFSSNFIPALSNNRVPIPHYPPNYFTSILFYPIITKLIGNHNSLSTQSTPDDGDDDDPSTTATKDEILNQIITTHRSAPHLTNERCNLYIHKLCKEGNFSLAIRLLKSLRDDKIFTPNAYSTLLAAAAERSRFDISFLIFKSLLVFRKPLSSDCYLNLARSCADMNDCVALIGFVKEVSELAFPDNMIVINRIIFAFGECRQIEKAVFVFNRIKDFGYKPDVITYNTVLDILGRAGRVDEMVGEFSSMKEGGLVPDFITYNTLLNNLRRVGSLDMSLVIFREMRDSGVEPDLLTYREMIEAFGRSGNTEEALRLFSEMKQRKIRPSIYIYRTLIDICKKAGKLDLAVLFSEEMKLFVSNLAGSKNFKRKRR